MIDREGVGSVGYGMYYYSLARESTTTTSTGMPK